MVSADYIVGLTDGEGCFYVLVRPPYNKYGGANVILNFFIKVQASDGEMLEQVKSTLGCGGLYFQKENRPNHSECIRYTVSSHKDIFSVIIPFFQTHPLLGEGKIRNFQLFCKIANLVKDGKHHTKDGIEQIQLLKSQMNHGARVVRESRSLRGDPELTQIQESARQVMEAGSG